MPGQIASSRPLLSLGGGNASLPNLSVPPKNPDGFFTLWTNRSASNTNGVTAFTKVGGAGSAGAYQVTAAKTLKVVSVCYAADTAGFNAWQFMTSTAAFDIGAAGTPTGAVYQFGASARYAFPVLAANTWYFLNYQYEFAATLYPGIQAATNPGTIVGILCHEV